MSMWKRACRCALSEGVPRRSLYVALIVGTTLNLINQGDALYGAGRINWVKVVLTYLVPYAVSTYGAVSYQLSRPPTCMSAIQLLAKGSRTSAPGPKRTCRKLARMSASEGSADIVKSVSVLDV